jgi:simple sugar transport system ATP-binding protein
LPARSLSGGNQQRVVLAKWLASNPRVLILNGPTVGVDVGSKAEIHEFIRSLAKQGIGILLISDDIPELMQTCHRILLMRAGKIVEEFRREDISEQELNTELVAASGAGNSKG